MRESKVSEEAGSRPSSAPSRASGHPAAAGSVPSAGLIGARGAHSITAAHLLGLQRTAGNRIARAAIDTADGSDRDGRLPRRLQLAMEEMSGVGLGDVRVHRQSPKPADMGALAYAQGNDVYLGPGQDHHLAHEAWHVVQQKQGRPHAGEMVDGQPVSTDKALEREADSMGELAMQKLAGPGIDLRPEDPARPSRPIPQRSVVIQGKWADINWLGPQDQQAGDLENALARMAAQVRAPALQQYQGLAELFTLGGAPLVGAVREYLRRTVQDEELHPTNDLLLAVVGMVSSGMRVPLGAAPDLGDDEENDHPEGEIAAPVDIPITDPQDINTKELQGEPQLLMAIFDTLARGMGERDFNKLAFDMWYHSGVVTRAGFKKILEEARARQLAPQQIIHMKRSPFTASGPKSYMSSNYGQFTNVTYTTDAKGNIDFSAPTSTAPAHTWSNPVKPGTVVNLKTGCNKPGYGILYPNTGTGAPPVLTKLHSANRNRHNMIAERLRPDLIAAAASTYTWHHRSQEYQMELVDYMVHRKHGHNGGYLFWQDGH